MKLNLDAHITRIGILLRERILNVFNEGRFIEISNAEQFVRFYGFLHIIVILFVVHPADELYLPPRCYIHLIIDLWDVYRYIYNI